MSERKVLNKYYPPDFDPSKIPKGKRNKNATFNIRIMAPFNMRCNMCKEYIYKGKKFNSRKEDVMDEFYLGLRIFRFYIKCPRCVSEIAFKTDLENTDYTLEAGATRLFEAEKIAMKMAEQERKEKEDDELNPMVVLENRTKASRAEMDQIDSLEEIREMNTRKNVVNTDEMIEKYRKYEQLLLELQIEREEEEIKEIFGEKGGQTIKRLHDSDSDEDGGHVVKKLATSTDVKPTDILAEEPVEVKKKKPEVWEKSVGSLSSKANLKGLIVKKKSSLPILSPSVQKEAVKSDNEKSDKSSPLTSPKWNFSAKTLNSPLAREPDSKDSNTKSVNKEDSNTMKEVSTHEVKSSTTDDKSEQTSSTEVKHTSTGNLLGLAYSDSDSESDDQS